MKFAVTALGLVFAAALPAAAHHSGAMYDRAHPTTSEVVVKEFDWINPHSVLEVTTPAGSDLTIEMTSPGVLTRSGWTKRSLQTGDHIKLTYAPLRAGGPVGFFLQATNAKGEVLSYTFAAGEKPGI